MTAHEIRLQAPRVDDRGVEFRWTVTPSTPLHRRTSFRLDFPPAARHGAVPETLWWRIGLVCLHQLWVLLRPCRVVLPVRLAPGEREGWLRLCDAAVWTLEGRRTDGVRETRRSVDLVESGPALPPLEPPAAADTDLVVACFSGGRDSLTQLGLLQELGRPALLVATTSPLPPISDHTAAGRARAFTGVVRRRGVELIDVRSDYREGLDHGFVLERYGSSVNELTDCLLYFAAALAVAHARGARLVLLAAEAELHMTERQAGLVVRHPHFMYAASTQRALTGLLAAAGIEYASLTAPLRAFQVHGVLAERYPDLLDLQFSCWLSGEDGRACSACVKCGMVAFNLLSAGVDPARAGIDLAILVSVPDLWPSRANIDPRAAAGPGQAHNLLREQQVRRALLATPPERMAEYAGPEVASTYAGLRDAALAGEPPPPAPGYLAQLLPLVPAGLRDGVRAIADEAFAPADDDEDGAWLRDTLALSTWVAAPLGAAA